VEKRGFRAALRTAGVSALQRVGFADELRVGLRGLVRRVWGRRGVKVQQRLQLTYEWRYLFLVVDGQAGRLDWCWLDSMAGDEIVAAVGGLQRETDLAALVWDGAQSHRDTRLATLGVPLLSLPPYSPELNPAERVFEEIRRWVEGRVYPTLAAKVAAVEAFLADLDAAPDRVRSLAGWDWITAALPQPAHHFTA
jgi:DDE superfamily endonuclease